MKHRAIRHWALALCWGFWACSCYSEPYTYGISPNAAASGLTWDMTSVLPKEAGLSVNGVFYQYTAVKNPADSMLVHVQNLNAKGSGYIFRETDDWTGRPGTTINKLVSLDNVPIGYWGKGSIAVEGTGLVVKPTVVYTYRIDPCYDPQSSPSCPGYKPVIPELPPVELYNALDDAAVELATRKTEAEYREQEERKAIAREQALKDTEDALNIGNGISQAAILQSLNSATNLSAYYGKYLHGGIYKDSIKLLDTKLPENRLGLRNGLAQQLLHNKMVEQQYER